MSCQTTILPFLKEAFPKQGEETHLRIFTTFSRGQTHRIVKKAGRQTGIIPVIKGGAPFRLPLTDSKSIAERYDKRWMLGNRVKRLLRNSKSRGRGGRWLPTFNPNAAELSKPVDHITKCSIVCDVSNLMLSCPHNYLLNLGKMIPYLSGIMKKLYPNLEAGGSGLHFSDGMFAGSESSGFSSQVEVCTEFGFKTYCEYGGKRSERHVDSALQKVLHNPNPESGNPDDRVFLVATDDGNIENGNEDSFPAAIAKRLVAGSHVVICGTKRRSESLVKLGELFPGQVRFLNLPGFIRKIADPLDRSSVKKWGRKSHGRFRL